MELKKQSKRALEVLNRESPTILTGLGVTGVFSTTILAVRATPTAVRLIERERRARFEEKEFDAEPITNMEKVKLTWKLYLPAALSGVTTIVCILASNRIHLQRTAALATVYAITESAFSEYQAKVVEMLGEKKEMSIRDEIAKRKLNQTPIEGQQVFITGAGEHLFLDSLSGRYFRSDIETIRHCVNNFNEEMFTDMYKTLNEFYDEIGLEQTDMGRNMGWDVENGLLEVHYSAQIATTGEPCIVLEYSIQPRFL